MGNWLCGNFLSVADVLFFLSFLFFLSMNCGGVGGVGVGESKSFSLPGFAPARREGIGSASSEYHDMVIDNRP